MWNLGRVSLCGEGHRFESYLEHCFLFSGRSTVGRKAVNFAMLVRFQPGEPNDGRADIVYHMSKRVLTPFRRKYLRFNVSEQRRKLKLQAIEYKGGKCINCGYNKCPAAMVFHHPDPNQKDFGIAANGISRSFEKIRSELDKCVLLCMICHAEFHHAEDEKAREEKRLEIEVEKRSYSKVAQLVVAPCC